MSNKTKSTENLKSLFSSASKANDSDSDNNPKSTRKASEKKPVTNRSDSEKIPKDIRLYADRYQKISEQKKKYDERHTLIRVDKDLYKDFADIVKSKDLSVKKVIERILLKVVKAKDSKATLEKLIEN